MQFHIQVSDFRGRFTLCVFILFSSVSVSGWLPFGKQLFTRLTICSLCIHGLTICSLCILTICNISFPCLVLRTGVGF